MINLMEYSANLSYKYSDPLVVDMPVSKARNLGTCLMPRGTARYHREFVPPADGCTVGRSSSWVRETRIFDINIRYPEPLKAFSSPPKDYYAHLWAKETLLNLAIAEAVERELKDQKKPGGILNKYGVE